MCARICVRACASRPYSLVSATPRRCVSRVFAFYGASVCPSTDLVPYGPYISLSFPSERQGDLYLILFATRSRARRRQGCQSPYCGSAPQITEIIKNSYFAWEVLVDARRLIVSLDERSSFESNHQGLIKYLSCMHIYEREYFSRASRLSKYCSNVVP